MTTFHHPRLFALLWVIAGMVIGPLAIALTLVATELLFPVALAHGSVALPDTFAEGLRLPQAVFGVIGGFGVGALQQLIVRHCLRVNLTGWWRASLIGGMLASAFMLLLMDPLDYSRVLNALYDLGFKWTELETVLFSLAFLLPLAGAQATMLRRHGAGGLNWALAHACPFLPLTLYAVLPVEFPAIVPELGFIFVFILPTMLLTAFTGIAMFRIATCGALDNKAKRQPAQSAA